MKWKSKALLLSKILIVLIIPVVLFSNNLMLLINPFYLNWEYSRRDFPESEIFTKSKRIILSRGVLAYVKNITDISSLQNTDLFNERELKHLDDVRVLTYNLSLVQKISFILLVYLLLFTILTDKKGYSVIRYALFGSILSILICLLLLSAIYLDFNSFFIKFHEILFSKGYWYFDLQDTLIQLYPRRFWIDSGIILVSLILIETLILCITSFVLMRRLKKIKNSNICIDNKIVEGTV